jgi:small-conductance mechanosensitive channel
MELLQRIGLSLAGAALIAALSLICRRRKLPLPPWRLALVGLVSWLLLGGGRSMATALGQPLWLAPIDDLLLGFAALRLTIWALLEVPAGLGWWRRPPELLLQLLMVGGAATITIVVVRQTAQVDLVGLVTTSAVLTAVLGFAAQGLLKDLIAGLELQLGDDFSVGDWIDLGAGTQGIVETVSWRDTKIRTMDDTLLVVPNSRMTQDVLINRSAFGPVTNRFELGLESGVPPARVRELLLQVLRNHPKVLQQPEPRVRLSSYGEHSLNYDLQVWQREAGMRAQVDLRGELLEQIWYAMHRRGWRIPYPVLELEPWRSKRADVPSSRGWPSPGPAMAANRLFAVLSSEEQARLCASGSLMRFGPGETIVREGEPGDSLFLLLSGEVEVRKRGADGSEAAVAVLPAGEVFGEMTLLLDAPRSATVRAVAETDLLEVERSCVSELLQHNPQLLLRLAKQVEERQAALDTIGSSSYSSEASALIDTMRRLLIDFWR